MESRPITNEYIQNFLEKKERPNPLMVKTKYGKNLESKFAVNNQKASMWLADKSRQNLSRRVGKS